MSGEYVSKCGEDFYEREDYATHIMECRECRGEPEPVSLRDRIAMAAMQGMLAASDCVAENKEIAKYSYEMADTMLKAREE